VQPCDVDCGDKLKKDKDIHELDVKLALVMQSSRDFAVAVPSEVAGYLPG